MIRPLHTLGLMAALAMLASAAPAQAQHAGKGKDKFETDAPGASGQVAATDAATGKLRAPTREEVQALVDAAAPSLSQSSEGLVPVRTASGAMVLDLQGRFESVSLARVDGGKVSTRCVDTPDEARRFLEAPATTATPAAPRAPALEEK